MVCNFTWGNMKLFKYIFLIICLVISLQGYADESSLKLWYKQPAQEWVEALPLGNGRLGAMVFGKVNKELVQLNEETLWSGRPVDLDPNPDAVKYLPLVREALFAGDWREATDLCHKMQGDYTQSYLPMADLEIDYGFSNEEVEEYKRELDISNAVSKISFIKEGITYKRELFVSAPEQLVLMKLSVNKKNALKFSASLSSLLKNEVVDEKDGLLLRGTAPVHVDPSYLNTPTPVIYEKDGNLGMRFAVRLVVESAGGNVVMRDGIVYVDNATEVIFRLSAATSFNGLNRDPYKQGKDELRCINDYLDHARQKSYAIIKKRHIDDYKSFFDRLSFNLKDDNYSRKKGMDTKERLLAYREGENDLQLEELYYHFNRYLLISCSRPDNIPANLQGIWNNLLRAPWSSNYTININAEMNYWPVEICNLSELHLPFINHVKSLSENGEHTAKNFFNARGWSLSHNSDIWGQTNPVGNRGMGDPAWANWYMGSPWVCQNLFEHYRFTGDKTYLKNEAYPIMKNAALFCLDWLVEDKDGWLVTAPSTSPENRYIDENGQVQCVSIATTMDMSIIWDLFTNLIEASEILGIDDSFRNVLKEKKSKLYPLHIGKKGNLQEWFKDYDDLDPHHRHVSHLFGLHPGRQITPFNTPELAKACQKTLELRGDNGTGWSLAWKINFWARLLDGEHAYKLLRKLLNVVDVREENYDGGGSYINLFCAHPPFQIDGNFGGLSGMTEMLIQSHENVIHLLPALPSAWKDGCIKGLCARNGFVIDMKWKNGVLVSGKLLSKLGEKCELRTSSPVRILGTDAVSEKQNSVWGTYYLTRFNTKVGKVYQVMSF